MLPSPPPLYVRIHDEVTPPYPNIGIVAVIVSSDPAMSAKVLQLVNSAFIGIAQHVSDPVNAVNLLGMDTLQAIAISAQVVRQFDDCSQTMELDQLWRHSVLVSQLAGMIARAEGCSAQVCADEKSAGMLHDVGKLVLRANLPNEYMRLRAQALALACRTVDLERRAWGTTHADVGAYLLGLWELPEKVVDRVASHHHVSNQFGNVLSAAEAVPAANLLANELHTNADTSLSIVASNDSGGPDPRLPAWWKLCRYELTGVDIKERKKSC